LCPLSLARSRDLLPIIDAAVILGFAHVEQGDILVILIGREFARVDMLHSKEICRQQLLSNMPIVATMYQILQQQNNRTRHAPTATPIDLGRATSILPMMRKRRL
jgi:hypothetical protein